MRKPFTQIRWWARDRRMSAVHEAGHARKLIIDSRPTLRLFVEYLDDQRRQRQRVELGSLSAVGTGDYDNSRHGGRP